MLKAQILFDGELKGGSSAMIWMLMQKFLFWNDSRTHLIFNTFMRSFASGDIRNSKRIFFSLRTTMMGRVSRENGERAFEKGSFFCHPLISACLENDAREMRAPDESAKERCRVTYVAWISLRLLLLHWERERERWARTHIAPHQPEKPYNIYTRDARASQITSNFLFCACAPEAEISFIIRSAPGKMRY